MARKRELRVNNSLYFKESRTDDIQGIITAVPPWILRWGILTILLILTGVLVGSSLIRFPEVITTSLKVNSLNAPKAILAHKSGKLKKLLISNGDMVLSNQPLAYLESTASHEDVLELSNKLSELKSQITLTNNRGEINLPVNLNLGEIQGDYQIFHQDFMDFIATENTGYFLQKKHLLERDLNNITAIRLSILKQMEIQNKEFENLNNEYTAYKRLYEKKVISRSEFMQQENKFFSGKQPLQQSEMTLLNNTASLNAKQKELLELKNQITEKQSQFLQSLNKFITIINEWVRNYILISPINGKVNFAGLIEQNQNLVENQEVLIVNPGNANFFGEIRIPQYNMGKIQEGQKTLVKLYGYPFEQFGMIEGRLSFVSEAAYQDSVFIAKVSFEKFKNKASERKIILKNGMQGSAEIITEDVSLLGRFLRSTIKLVKSSN